VKRGKTLARGDGGKNKGKTKENPAWGFTKGRKKKIEFRWKRGDKRVGRKREGKRLERKE